MRTGKRLVLWLDAKGLKQQDLAKALGVSQAAVSQWRSGHCDPRYQTLQDAISWLGLSEPEFYGQIKETGRADA